MDYVQQINDKETAPLIKKGRNPTVKKLLVFTVIALIGTVAFIAYSRTSTATVIFITFLFRLISLYQPKQKIT